MTRTVTKSRQAERLVRYISPFGSPAVLRESIAEDLLARDDAHWLRMQLVGNLSAEQRRIGPPRIERWRS